MCSGQHGSRVAAVLLLLLLVIAAESSHHSYKPRNYHGSSKYKPLLDFPELDYGKATEAHKKSAAGPPVYFAQASPYSHEPTYVAESAVVVPDYILPSYATAPAHVNKHQHQHSHPHQHQYQHNQYNNHHQQQQHQQHPYKADGEAQIDVHSTPDGFSYQVVEERGKGSYSSVSQTRDFSKKVPNYSGYNNHNYVHDYPLQKQQQQQQQQHGLHRPVFVDHVAPLPPYPDHILPPPPPPVPSIYDLGKPRTYAATQHLNEPKAHLKNYGAGLHQVRSYSLN